MPRDDGRVDLAEPANINSPESAVILHIFVDSADSDTLKAKLSDGSVRVFQADGNDVLLAP